MNSPILVTYQADRLRDTWQGRALAVAKGRTAAVLLAVLAAEWPSVLPILLRVVFPGFQDIGRPFLRGYAQIMPSGAVVCEMVDRDGRSMPSVIYDTQDRLLGDFRRLADRLKLKDEDRVTLFAVLGKWIVKDARVDHEGRKLAS